MNESDNSVGVRVRVPATTANLGPGFDALGLALRLHNYVSLTARASGGVEVAVSGEGASTLPRGEDNIAVRAARQAFEAIGEQPAGLRLHLENAIPLSRGLGSSAAARVGAVVAANELAGGKLSREDLLALAVDLEGHPDNVSAALHGGLVASTIDDRSGRALALKVSAERLPSAVVLVPEVEIATEDARNVLPDHYARADVGANLGHACLTLAALIEGGDSVLAATMRDKVHQPYRETLMPWMSSVIEAALEAGALGAALSGAGSTMLAFARGNEERVAEAMLNAVAPHEVTAKTHVLFVDDQGATVVDSPSGPSDSILGLDKLNRRCAPMAATWALQDAKNQLSEVVNRASTEGPQTITRRGQEAAVVLSIADYRSLSKSEANLVDFLRKSPLAGVDLELTRR